MPTSAQSKVTKNDKTPAMKGAVESKSGLADLFLHGVKDIYYAEKKLIKALPKMIKAAKSQDLIDALEGHLKETEEHVEKVEEIFGLLGETPRATKCDAIDGIIEEADGIMKEFGKTGAADAAIIFAGQAAEHYEITRYGSLRAFAEILKYEDAERLLEGILEQEKAADKKLTEIAEDRIDWAAAHNTTDNPNGTPSNDSEKNKWRLWH